MSKPNRIRPRVSVSIAPDVEQRLRERAHATGAALSDLVEQALRAALDVPAPVPSEAA